MKGHLLMLRIPRLLLPAIALLCFLAWATPAVATGLGPVTGIHKAGFCALRGQVPFHSFHLLELPNGALNLADANESVQCGKKSFFGGQLPCPHNEPATEPDSDFRARLVALCGDTWKESRVCCDDNQVCWNKRTLQLGIRLGFELC